jgi:uncharacterized membrane protein YdcZ (DUF606 family)
VRARRWAANLAWTVAGILIYALCIDVFGGYPRYHTEALSLAALILMVLLGVSVWCRHERRDDER